MSLLLDALKRAEQEKHARHGQEPAHAEQSPVAAPRVSGQVRIAKLELEAAEPSAPATQSAPPSVRNREREAAKTVFAAKQPETLPPAPPTGASKAIVAIGVGALLVLGAGGAYVWYAVGKAGAPVARPLQPAIAPAPIAAPRIIPVAPATVTASTAPAPALPAETGPPAAQPAAVPKSATPRPASPAAAPVPGRPGPLAARVLRDAAATAEGASTLKLAPTSDPPRVPPNVSQGYDALRRGDVATARRLYEAALAVDPANLDAHLGLATVSARAGDRGTASRHYRRALELDPRNSTALAGLAALQDFSRPDGLEAKLRADIAQSPQSPALHFTLGTLYASQARWTEAQAAYFEAYRLEPESADIAYNLAVSLDNLGQAKLAADFYGRALATAQGRDAQFDKDQVSRRIAELKP